MAAAIDPTATLLRHPYAIMLASLLLVLAIGAGASRLSVDSGIDIFFAADDPNLLAEQRLKATYGREDNILLVVEAGPDGVFTADTLAALETLTARSWLMPHSRRVDSPTSFLHAAVDGDDIVIAPLVEDTSLLTPADIERIARIARAEPALQGRLLGPAGDVAAINVTLLLPREDTAAAIAEAVGYARDLAADVMAAHPQLEIHLTGWAVTEQTLADVTAADGATLMPALFALVLVALALLLRSILASLCTVVVIALSIAVGMGFAGWTGIALNSVNVSAPTIILTLAVADCIHLLSAHLRELRRDVDRRTALAAALRETAYPITLTSITTAAGFLSMNFSESPPFRELGTVAAVGVIGAWWVTLTILPALVLALPFSARQGARTGLPMAGLARLVTRHHRGFFTGSLAVILVTVLGITRIELNDDPSGYFSGEVPLKRALDVVESRLSGVQTLHYSLGAGSSDGITEPGYLGEVDAFAAWLRAQPEVTNVEVFTDTLKRLNQVMHGDDPAWHRLPDSREMAAQYTLLYEISVPYGQDVTHLVSADKSSLKVSATLKNQQSAGLIAFEARARDWLEQHAPTLATAGAGQSISFAHVGLRNIESMLTGSLLAVLLISGCLVLAFRSFRFGLISLVPNLFPALVALGIWGWLVGQVNIAASVVFSLTLGIIVDDTTHFLVRYINARRERGMTPEDAIHHTFTTVGSALVSTTIVLSLGFLALVQSDFSVNATSGLLVAMTIVIAIVLDLLFLPALLMRADRLLLGERQTRAAGSSGHTAEAGRPDR